MILFTADWHIKLGQKNVPVKWATNRYQMFFQQIYELEKDCAMHIIGGDLFDVFRIWKSWSFTSPLFEE